MKFANSPFSLLLFFLSVLFIIPNCKKGDDTPKPSVSSVEPAFGIAGDPVKIKGSNFMDADKISFGTVTAAIVHNTGSEILTNIPPGATIGMNKITVHTAAGISGGTDFEVIKTPDHVDALPPEIISVTPSSSYIDYPVLIYGNNLSGVIKLTFNDKAAPVYAQNQNVVTTAVPKDLPTGTVTIKLITTKGDYTKQFQVQGAPPPNINPGSFTIVIPPPPNYVQSISNNWSCGLFSNFDDIDNFHFHDPGSDDGNFNYSITGRFEYDFDKTKNYNDLNYVEFTNTVTGETKVGMFSSKYNNPCVLTMVLVSTLDKTVSLCTFDKRSNDPDLDCEHD